jgi:hypothetical protein
MLGIAVCWLTLKVPSLLRSRHSQAGLWNSQPAFGGSSRSSPRAAPLGRSAVRRQAVAVVRPQREALRLVVRRGRLRLGGLSRYSIRL